MKKKRDFIVRFYITNAAYINNWDLVDTSAAYILGDYLLDKDKKILYVFAASKSIWERRIAIVATHAFIKKHQFADTLKIAKILLNDNHDLIQKAVGWMLREVGNRSPKAEFRFLDAHYKKMPRTMLRYAIERFPMKQRKYYMTR